MYNINNINVVKFPRITIKLSNFEGSIFRLADICSSAMRKAGRNSAEIGQFNYEIDRSASLEQAVEKISKYFNCI